MVTFTDLGIKKDVVSILTSLKITTPTDVQEQVIPLALKGKHIVFTSRTGSGKTLACLLGFISKINKKQALQMVVLVPTRELCIQFGKEIGRVCEPLGINVGMLYGGREKKGDQRTTSKKNHIIVGTPGRFIQHVNAKSIKVGDVSYVVYDESDQMFDNGFYDECAYLKKRVSKNAQVLLSSATISNRVHEFITQEIKDYEQLEVGDEIPRHITQEKLYCAIREKNDILITFFTKKKFKRAIVFCNTKVRSYHLCELLKKNKLKARALNSDFKQDERNNTLNLFKQGKVSILVTTDVAARGLHIENVDIVINYDVSRQPEFHVHRLGRTGRKDTKGYVLTFICPEDEKRFTEITDWYDLDVTLVDHDFKKVKEEKEKKN